MVELINIFFTKNVQKLDDTYLYNFTESANFIIDLKNKINNLLVFLKMNYHKPKNNY
jgi:hypothetical protein